jgi:hypothetical protein
MSTFDTHIMLTEALVTTLSFVRELKKYKDKSRHYSEELKPID